MTHNKIKSKLPALFAILFFLGILSLTFFTNTVEAKEASTYCYFWSEPFQDCFSNPINCMCGIIVN